jgi:plastocyanin
MARVSIVSLVLSLGLAASAANIQVDVGKTGLTYDPETVTAQAGDTVTYNFHPKVSTQFPNSLNDY